MHFLGRLGVETSPERYNNMTEREKEARRRAGDLVESIIEVASMTKEEVDDSLRAAADAVEKTVFRAAAAKVLPGVDCWATPIPAILVALQEAGIDPTPLREEALAARERFLAAQARLGK